MVHDIDDNDIRYRTPETVPVSLECDVIIAQSPLEDVTEGDEWGWEE